MHYTDKDRALVGKINAALGIEQINLLQEGMTGAAKAIEDYLASASFDSRLRLAKIIQSA